MTCRKNAYEIPELQAQKIKVFATLSYQRNRKKKEKRKKEKGPGEKRFSESETK
ncbi:MAG: hypothetical protein PHW56_01055 [Methanosarcinaceae archaeon]|nr:hypothetical protein [Methanosarcinaceae archaeon]